MRIITYQDTSAPTLSSSAGSLITVLDAVLVNGFGSTSPLGWTKPYSGTNQAKYRMGAGIMHYLLVADDSTSGSATIAACAGFETSDSISSGTGRYPAVGQGISSLGWVSCVKSTVASAPWYIIGDERSFTLVTYFSGTDGGDARCFHFGEYYNYGSPFTYRGNIVGQSSFSTSQSFESLHAVNVINTTAAIAGSFVCRPATGNPTSVNVGRIGDRSRGGYDAASNNIGVVPFPNSSDGGIYLAPIRITDPTTTPVGGILGHLRGIWHQVHPSLSLVHKGVYQGSGALAGKSFIMLYSSIVVGNHVFEISDNVDTN